MASAIQIEKFLAALKRHRIPFMAVGASAAALQGANIFTNDFDIWLEKLDFFQLAGIAKQAGGCALFTEWHAVQVHLPEETAIDVVLTVTGMDSFRAAWKRAQRVRLGRTEIKALDFADIIKSKEALGREKDIRTLPQLKDFLRARDARNQAFRRSKKRAS
jgi:hypothetical protein